MVLAAVAHDPFLLKIVAIALGVLVVGLILHLLKMNHVVIYIISGVLLGPHGLGIVEDMELVNSLGSLGLILLLFFIGMEISLRDLLAHWRVPVTGTILQIVFSVGVVALIGWTFDWSWARILTLGFVISLSSTAVIVKLLQSRQQIELPVGRNVLGILLIQDILLVPMLIILNYATGQPVGTKEVTLQILGGIGVIAFIMLLLSRPQFRLPFHGMIRRDHELQVFFAFALCFGFAAISGLLGLSTALGAFLAGLLVAASRTTEWFHHSLFSFKVIFLALFFMSVGMLIDLPFLIEHLGLIALLVVLVLVGNNLINTLILRALRRPWRESFYGGALLAQVGEFSFLLGSIAYANHIITDFGYQIIVAVIAISLLVSPLWIQVMQRASGYR